MHAHRKAVALGVALPIRCPDCDDELVPVVAKNEGPALRCLACRCVFTPGIDTWDQIQVALKEAADNV